MQSIWSFEELQRILDDEFPGLKVFRWPSGRWSIEQEYDELQVCELDPSYAIDGFGYKAKGWQMVFDVKNRLLGGWIIEELRKRDPRYADRQGNRYHEGWKASFQAEAEHEKMKQDSKESALQMWETAKRNPALMERVSRRLAAGDPNAWQEFSPETMMKHALKESPRELRNKDYWRSI